MGYIAKLEHGASELDLSSGAYALMSEFTPPTTPQSVYTAAGTSANVHGGASFVGKRANNMSFVFAVRIKGDSVAETDMSVRAVSAFLNRAGDEGKPVYFAWKADNNLTYDPMWGQFGALLRCEVVSGKVDKTPLYGVGNVRNEEQMIILSLQLKPYARGLKQRVGSAKGGICEDWIGAVDGVSRGVQVPEASGTGGNLHKNPIFGHATYNQNWVDDANVTDTENNDETFILFGISSVKLWATASDQYTETLTLTNLADYTISYYVKKPDGSAITIADVECHYDGSDLTTTYTSVGDGWYRISATATGDGAAGKVGVTVNADRLVYLDAAQCELKDYVTPFFYGDMLDCAWGGTAHNSVSTRVVAYLRYPGSEVYSQEWSCRIVWKADKNSTELGGAEITHFSDNSANYFLHYDDTLTRWRFSDTASANALKSGAFSTGDIIVIHCTVGPTTGYQIYIDGVAGTADASYAQFATPSWLYIGSNNTPTEHTNGTFLGFATFDREMIATEVTADYNNASEWVSGGDGTGRRLEAIPWCHTIGGDDVCDKYIDSTHSDYAIVGGIQGDTQADTIFELENSANGRPITVCNNAHRVYAGEAAAGLNDLFVDHQGVAVAGALNGEVDRTGLTLASTVLVADDINIGYQHSAYFGKTMYLYVRCADAGSDLQMRLRQLVSTYPIVVGDWQDISADASLRQFLVGPIKIIEPKKGTVYDWINEPTLLVLLDGQRTVSGAANVDTDITQAFIGDLAFINVTGSFPTHKVILHGREAFGFLQTTGNRFEMPSVRGDTIELYPDQINHLLVYSADMFGADSRAYTETTTINRIYVSPRYSVL